MQAFFTAEEHKVYTLIRKVGVSASVVHNICDALTYRPWWRYNCRDNKELNGLEKVFSKLGYTAGRVINPYSPGRDRLLVVMSEGKYLGEALRETNMSAKEVESYIFKEIEGYANALADHSWGRTTLNDADRCDIHNTALRLYTKHYTPLKESMGEPVTEDFREFFNKLKREGRP